MSTLLTDEEVRKLLRVSRTTIWRMRKSEGLPFVRVGRQYRYEEEAVLSWMARCAEKGRLEPYAEGSQ